MEERLKKLRQSVLVISVLMISNSVIAADVGVNYNGEVTQSSCKVDGVGSALSISMGKIQESQFTEIGKKVGRTETIFTLKGCPDNVAIQFDGAADPTSVKYLKLSNAGQTGAADGYAFAIEALIDGRYLSNGGNIDMVWPQYRTGQLHHAEPDRVMRLGLASSIVATRDVNRKAGKTQGIFTFTFINP